jgi:guanine deaminase
VVLRHAADADDALAKVFALGGSADVRGVWVEGDRLR